MQKGDSSNSFTKLTFSDGVTTIKGKVFGSFLSLKSVTIPSSISSIDEQAFVDCTGELFVNCKILTGAFNDSDFTKVTIGNSVASIGSEAFYNCDKLESIDIAASVKSIGSWAFYNCGKLESVTIPADVTSIGLYAFNGCSSLENVYCEPVNPPTLNLHVFSGNASGRLIHVQSASESAYKTAANWSAYADVIVGDLDK